MRETAGIVGAGNSARALSVYLASHGYPVCMYSRNAEKLEDVRRSGSIRAEGMFEGVFPVKLVTDDYAVLAKHCDVIFVATTADAYGDVAEKLGPHLHRQHLLILFSGKLCGSLEAATALAKVDRPHVPVIETDALFACRTQSDCAVRILGFKEWTLFACPRNSHTRRFGSVLKKFFPKLEEAQNLIQRGLTDFGAVAHAVIMMANFSKIDRNEPFLFYYDGVSPRTVALLDEMESEFRSVANAYAADLIGMKELLNRYYGCRTESLGRAITSVQAYSTIQAPQTLNHRFFQEDVACTLVPLQGLARKAEIDTPMIDAIINIASIVGQRDFRTTGRTLDRLGWKNWTRNEIVQWLRQ